LTAAPAIAHHARYLSPGSFFTAKPGSPLKANQHSAYCWAHDPAHAETAAEARRLGGLRRRREVTLLGAYDVDGLTSVAGVRRLLEVAILDTLGLENSLPRARTLGYLAQIAAKLLETGELEDRIKTLEAAVLRRDREEPSVFDGPHVLNDDDWGGT
jgi:hypothetical protein